MFFFRRNKNKSPKMTIPTLEKVLEVTITIDSHSYVDSLETTEIHIKPGHLGRTDVQIVLHEYGHIVQHRCALSNKKGWVVTKDFFGEYATNPSFEKWFTKQNFSVHGDGLHHSKREWYRSHIEWWAEAHSILVLKGLGISLDEDQIFFYEKTIKGTCIPSSLKNQVKSTLKLLS